MVRVCAITLDGDALVDDDGGFGYARLLHGDDGAGRRAFRVNRRLKRGEVAAGSTDGDVRVGVGVGAIGDNVLHAVRSRIKNQKVSAIYKLPSCNLFSGVHPGVFDTIEFCRRGNRLSCNAWSFS
jgi:hypothetical protein